MHDHILHSLDIFNHEILAVFLKLSKSTLESLYSFVCLNNEICKLKDTSKWIMKVICLFLLPRHKKLLSSSAVMAYWAISLQKSYLLFMKQTWPWNKELNLKSDIQLTWKSPRWNGIGWSIVQRRALCTSGQTFHHLGPTCAPTLGSRVLHREY